ncbi:hypothetical protein FOCC_FOCC007483 [Frankliniella occidentalis]|nr:hypothetical protein FOCC_FOCC007483 [Frankliniella occidentalis]
MNQTLLERNYAENYAGPSCNMLHYLSKSWQHSYATALTETQFVVDFCRQGVNGTWSLPGFVCDFYIAMDVTCSTSSIFNLVAISIDRYIAVTQPIKYAKHKNNRRVWCTIVVVWLVSCAIGTPIVLGLNNTPDRSPDLCIFYNTDFVIYSSLSSFYIPCMIMIVLYFNIYKVSLTTVVTFCKKSSTSALS